ncbi:MAG TPA: pilus assembly protein TadG-related protein [Pirellulales bacterium]|nr:pilus assembly protein TadG-related protein [Pirellulales bacterium]
MKRPKTCRSDRRGALAPLTAFLMVPLLGMVAFGVDVGWMVLAQSDLQNSADAAALAGAQSLMGQPTLSPSGRYTLNGGYVQYYLAGQSQQSAILTAAQQAAIANAKLYAGKNSAGTVTSLSLNNGDVQFGNTDANGNFIASSSGYPNTVQVTMRLDGQANGALPLAFAAIFGKTSQSMLATASATIYTGTVNSLQNGSLLPSHMLPMAYDVNHWNNFLATGQAPDGTTGSAVNGAPQLSVYPSTQFTGNFGLLSLDQSTDGASTISNWINNGVQASDLQPEFNANLLPLSAHDPNTWDWKGNPGLKTSVIHTLANHVGDSYLMPLFKPYNAGVPNPATYAAGTGNGTNYYYNVVQFVGVTITYVDNGSVSVQPCGVLDPNAVFSSVAPAAAPTASTPLVSTFAAPKLTQ